MRLVLFVQPPLKMRALGGGLHLHHLVMVQLQVFGARVGTEGVGRPAVKVVGGNLCRSKTNKQTDKQTG